MRFDGDDDGTRGPILQRRLLRRTDLTLAEKVLISYLDDRIQFFRSDGKEYFEGTKTIAYRLGTPHTTIRNALRSLVEKGWLAKTARPGKTSVLHLTLSKLDRHPVQVGQTTLSNLDTEVTEVKYPKEATAPPERPAPQVALKELRAEVIGAWRKSFVNGDGEVVEPTGRDLAEIPRAARAIRIHLPDLPARLRRIRLYRQAQGWDHTLFACLQNISRKLPGEAGGGTPSGPQRFDGEAYRQSLAAIASGSDGGGA